MRDPLEKLAVRVEADPLFLASILAEYAQAEECDPAGLAQALGCRVEDFTGLGLCRAPRPEPASFRADCRHIAERFGLDLNKLMRFVRQGEALRRLRQGSGGAPGFLMAARDRPEEPPAPEEGNEP